MFWLIQPTYASCGPDLWDDEDDYFEKHERCPLNADHGFAVRRWAPAKFREGPELEWAPFDRNLDAFSTPRSSLVFTRCVFAALEEAGLTGWLMNPATVSFTDGTVSTDYGELWIDGFGGVAPPSTGCKLLWRCRGCGLSEYQGGSDFMKRAELVRRSGAYVEAKGGFDFGAAIEQANWDGSDFFIIWPLMNFPICTDRARNVLEQFRIDKISFKNPREIEPIEFYGDRPIPPYYKPAARAEIEAYWAKAPVWPDDFEKPAP